MSTEYQYNQTGAERKALVQAISELLAVPASYQGAPTFAYTIGGCSVDRNGVLSFTEGIDQEEAERVVSGLRERGFVADDASGEDAPAEENATEMAAEADMESGADETEEAIAEDTAAAAEGSPAGDNALTIEMPKAGFTDIALDNLHKIVASKATLLKKALDAASLPIIDTGDSLRFPWFTLKGIEGEADAYSRLVAAICQMAKERKRVTAKECGTENDKFHMRLFLVQLGFIGDEYKVARKILLKNLSGNSSWKAGHAPVRAASNTEAGSTETALPEGPEEDMTHPETEESDAYGG